MVRFLARKFSQLVDRCFIAPDAIDTSGEIIQEPEVNSSSVMATVADAQTSLNLSTHAETIRWAGVDLPLEQASEGFAIIGGSKSGKSLMIQSLMQSVFPRIGSQVTPSRAIVFDSKRQWFSLLSNLELASPVKTLNPFDERGYRWNIAADVCSPAGARKFANALFPNPEDRPARTVTAGIIEAFIALSKDRWDLRDVVIALKSHRMASLILRHCESTRSIAEEWLGDFQQQQDLFESMEGHLAPLSEIASGWSQADSENAISFSEWIDQESILLLGGHPRVSSTMQNLEHYFSEFLAEQLSAAGERGAQAKGHTWILLDNVSDCDPIPALPGLLAAGGSCCVLGVRSIMALRTAYGNDVADEMLSACGNQWFLRSDDPDTASYSADYFPSLEATDFLNLPKPVRGQGLGIDGYARSSTLPHPYHAQITSEALAGELTPADIYTSDFSERETIPLRMWDESDLNRLSLSHFKSPFLKEREKLPLGTMPSSGRDELA